MMSTDSLKICPICDFSNAATSILCGNPGCFADLTQISISHPPLRQESPPADAPESETDHQNRLCQNGHPLEPADELCLECGAPPAADDENESERESPVLAIDGHELGELSQSGTDGREIFLNPELKRRTVLFPTGYEPDVARGERLAELDSDEARETLPNLIETGRLAEADDRCFEVWTFVEGDPLSEIPDHAEALASQMAIALSALHQAGLVCRGLRPDRIVMTGENGFHFHLRDLDDATLADFGVTMRVGGGDNDDSNDAHFLAPEAAVGRYEEASDWWALGMILLRCLTRGEGLPEISADAFLLQLITRGVPVPDNIDPAWQHVLKGLLTRNPANRWRGDELLRWFEGARNIPVYYIGDGEDKSGKVPISIGDQTCHSPEQWALAAAPAANWEDAKLQLSRGGLTTWLEDIEVPKETLETVGRYRDSLVPGLDDDENLLLVLLTLNDQLPLIWKGEVVNPEWLLTHAELALGWLEGNLVKELEEAGRIDWLTALAHRLERAETLCREMAVEVDRASLRTAALVSDSAILVRRWKRRRRNFPRAHHRGLEVLCEKSAPLPEELLVLLSADLSQFRTAEAILEDAGREAETAKVDFFCSESAREWVGESQRDLILELNRRIANFSRCNIERLDEWADTFRYERLISLPRILVLLQVPESQWKAPPQQAYLRNLFEFFHKRILAGIQRGALMNLRISANSRNIDLTELDGENQPATRILDHLIRREKSVIAIDPGVFINQTIIERRIRRLTRVAADYYRDTGIASLYLGYPLLVIRPSSSTVTARPKRAPLFLWPLRIETSGGYSGRVRVAFDRARQGDIESAGIELNPALQPMLKGEEVDALRGALAEALSRSGIDHKAFYELCQEALSDEIEDAFRRAGKVAFRNSGGRSRGGTFAVGGCVFYLRFLSANHFSGHPSAPGTFPPRRSPRHPGACPGNGII